MGFITIDTLKDAENSVRAAEASLDDGQPHAAMLHVKDTFYELERAANHKGEDRWFARYAYDGLHGDISRRSATLRPDDEDVDEMIRDIKTLAVRTRNKTVPQVQEFAEGRGDDIIPEFQFYFRSEVSA